MENKYTISIFTENNIGLLNRVSIIFTRRHLNIESITASESEVKNIHRYTIVLNCSEEQVIKVVAQIDKLVEVLKAFYHLDEETVYQEIALYKVPTSALAAGKRAEQILRKHNARILSVEPEFTVIEKTGHKKETQDLLEELEPHGVLEFARSGRVAVTKPMKEFKEYLKELELAQQ
jgi:acetolactate synthase I/III small subunit